LQQYSAHFTKINTAGDLMIEKNAADNTEVMEIWNWYKRALTANVIAEIPKGYWHYGTFSNGIAIPKEVRVFFRRRADLMKFFEDPFSVMGNSYFEWIRREEPALLK